jgi:AcrR family transcriptional regulator
MLLKQDTGTQSGLKKLDPRIKRTRQLLMQALMELMGEKSFQAITIQDIAERATVNRVTFYAHFEDKYALLEYMIREQFRGHLHGKLPEGQLYTPANLALLIQTVCEFLSRMGSHCPPPYGQLEPLMEKQIKGELYDLLLYWLANLPADSQSKRPTPEQAAMVTSWAIYGAAMQWNNQQGRSQSMADFVQQVFPMISASFEPMAR